MKALLKSLLTVCITTMAISAFAEEEIHGAFGKNLGEVFDPVAATATSTNLHGVTMYEFIPTNGIGSFQHYYVMITPITHKIYSILGIGSVMNTKAGRAEQSVIMGILREKYGPESEFKLGPIDSMGDVKRIRQGNRHIITTVISTSDTTLTLRYYDEDLEKLAEMERLAERMSKTDKSGL